MIELTDKDLKNHPQAIFKELLSKFRRPKVLVVAPNYHPLLDPSVPALEQIVHEMHGELFVVDIQRYFGDRSPGGLGGLDFYKKNYKAIIEFGIDTRMPTLAAADTLKTPFKDGCIDLIFLHNMSKLFEGGAGEEILREQFRILQKDGFLLLVDSSWPSRYLLARNKLKVKGLLVKDKYLITLSGDMSMDGTSLYKKKKLIGSIGETIAIGFDFEKGKPFGFPLNDRTLMLYKGHLALYIHPRLATENCAILTRK